MANGTDNTQAQPAQQDAIDELLKQIGAPPPREFPNAQDVQQWKNTGMFYGTPMEAYSQAGQARQNIYPMANVPDWLESPTGEIKGASLQPILPNQSQNMTRAYIAAQRSPVAALGFDPHHIATSPESQVSMDFAGGYNLPSDMAWYDPAYQTTPVHESIHRGLRMLREANMMPNLGVHSYPAAEELLVRRFMDRLFPEAEYGRGPTGDQQIRDARRLIPFSDLDKIDEAAQQLYAQTHPRGPRASGGRTGYSPLDPRMRMLSAPFSGRSIGPETDPSRPVVQDLSFDAIIDPASSDAEKWRKANGGAAGYQEGGGTFADKWQGINDPRMSDEIVKANQQQTDNVPDPLPNESFSDYAKRAGVPLAPSGDDEVMRAIKNAQQGSFISDVQKAGGVMPSGNFEADLAKLGPAPAQGGGDEVMQALRKAQQATPLDDILKTPTAPAQPQPTPAQQPQVQSWSDVPLTALSNVPGSAVQFAQNVAQPFIHPVQTYENLRDLGHGVLQKAGIVGGEEDKPKVDAVMQFLKDRYGSMDAVRNTIATDPVGFAADASALLTGGGGLAARTPGLLGRAGEIAQTAGRWTDPLALAASPATGAGKAIAQAAGFTTGAGRKAVQEAALAGYEGGEKATAFQQNLRGTAMGEDTVREARTAMDNLRKQRAQAYLEGIRETGGEYPFGGMSFDKIDAALADMASVKTVFGEPIQESTQDVRAAIAAKIQRWKDLSKADPRFSSPLGFDGLKQAIGDIRDNTLPGSPQRVVASKAYSAVRQTIIDQVPQYAKVMKGYEQASDTLRELEKTLSLPIDQRGVSVDTTLRKLQSVLRNNVNTAYGRRAELAQYLMDNGAPNLMARLSGQALSAPWSRGIGKIGMEIGMSMMGLLGYHAGGLGSAALAAGAMVPLYSPRLVGEAAYYAGRMAAPAKYLGMAEQPAFQTGRLSNVTGYPAYQ